MNKKPYTAPTVKKVELAYKSAILGVCHTSPNLYPATEHNGGWSYACYDQNLGCPEGAHP